MNKRIISMVLCMAMVMSFVVPGAFAAETTDDIYYVQTSEPTIDVSDTVPSEPEETIVATESIPTETIVAVEETIPAQTEPVEQGIVCDCGSRTDLLIVHSDKCAMKDYYMALCAQSGGQIFNEWSGMPANVRAFVMSYLSYQYPDTLKELVFLLASRWDVDGELKGVAAAIKDGTVFGTFGIPEDAVLQIEEAASKTKAVIDAFIAGQIDAGEELFTWDISVLQNGLSWQPDGTVRVEMELPGGKLHKHAKVFVVHVDDNGVAERIPAEVIDGNKIAFVTKGFSTFAAFTVDFEYDGVPFSIPGMSSIKLSELMDKLEMPFDVTDVADVAFTNYDLVSVEKQESDWVLTSRKAFTSEEALTLTMIDGNVYVINVTDAIPYPTICWGNDNNEDAGSNGAEDWYLTTYKTDSSIDNSHTENYDIRIDGTNATNKTFTIVLQRNASDTGRTLYLDLHTVWIKGGANLVIRLGGSITNENTDKIVITQVPGYDNDTSSGDWWLGELFWVENGSLEIRPEYEDQSNVRIQLDVQSDALNSTTYGGAKSLISLRKNAKYLKLDQVDFLNCHTSAVVVRANDLSEFTMTDCSFSSGCYSSGNAGAIYVRETTEDNETYIVDIAKMTLNNVRFNGTHAASHGGAISIRGRVNTLLQLNQCTFTNTYAGGHGGAIHLGNNTAATSVPNFELNGCTFDGCYINTTDGTGRGGAVYTILTGNNYITIDDCDFLNCKAGSLGGGFSSQGSVGNFTVRNGSRFLNCFANARGGAIALSSVSVGDITISGSTFTGNTAGTIGGAVHVGLDGAVSDDNKLIAGPINVGAVNVDGCTFSDNMAHGVGGALAFVDGTYESLAVRNTTFDDCDSTGFGGAIGLKVYKESHRDLVPVKVTGDVLIENCEFTNCDAGSLGLEAPDATWDHDGDPSTPVIPQLNGEGGTGGICIGAEVGGTVTIQGNSEKKMRFYNCNSWNNGGAIAFITGFSAKSVTMEYLEIDTCRARDAGNAIYTANVQMKNLYLKNSVIKNCTFFEPGFEIDASVGRGKGIPAEYDNISMDALNKTFDASGTFRTIGNTSTVAEVTDCQFFGNKSDSNGGGIYWNANRISTFSDGSVITPKLTLTRVTFTGNHAYRDGGALYCEATIYLEEGCLFTRNSADGRGGAIAQQVYNNDSRMLGEGEATNLNLHETTIISNNTATHGGGISITVSQTISVPDGTNVIYPVIFNLNGAQVYSNMATGNGGGIYYATTQYDDPVLQREVDNFKKQININGGSIYSNIAGFGADVDNNVGGGNGGGIYMSSHQVNTGDDTGFSQIVITDGAITNNVATNGAGGGIYLTGKNALCTMVGGVVGGKTTHANIATGNRSNNTGKGGGIAVSGGAKILMDLATGSSTGGVVSYNTASFQGGGIWLDHITGTVENGHVGNAIEVKAGTIEYNQVTAPSSINANGGGVYAGDSSTFILAGGTINHNTTPGWGGGVYAAVNVTVTISEGTISYNSSNAGGGIALEKWDALTFTDGEIFMNTAESHGGGIFANNSCNVFINGGNITMNTVTNSTGYGGGLSLTATKLIMNGGMIANNKVSADGSNGHGGGIFAQTASTVTVNGGDISNNVSGTYGGGIYVKDRSQVFVNGGSITNNSAMSGGGIFAQGNYTFKQGTDEPNYETTVTVVGGKIAENVANGTGIYTGMGGGIHADRFVDVTVKKSDDGTTYGIITENTASKGGGVYVVAGAKLTVKDGFITYNNAIDASGKGNGYTTTYLKNHGLSGVGGGIYVCSGYSESVKSKFVLEGTNIGIYGNLADFAADDVFSNAEKTSLTIPGVQNMNLTGYEFAPEGWVEDYCNADINYLLGTESVLGQNDYINGNNNGKIDGNENVRYRGSDAFKRMIIPDVKINAAVNADNAFVCMTLGIPAALPDTVVIDFGLPVIINVLDNDMMTRDVKTLAGIYNDVTIDTGDKTYTAALSNKYTKNTMDCDYGSIQVTGDQIKYTPNTMNMVKEDVFSYSVHYGNFYYYADVTVIPATIIYYEDNFDGSDGKDYISYQTFTYTEGSNTATELKGDNNKWKAVKKIVDASEFPEGLTQDQDRPGPMNGDDMDQIYGSDSAYRNQGRYSMGTAMKFTATQNGENKTYGTATFEFTGTGFDLISMTSGATGTIMVEVKQGNVAKKQLVVDTYYGMTFTDDGKWEVSDQDRPLYQVPVVKVLDLPYGTYSVTITATYNSYFDHVIETGDVKSYDFYLDAIRIYDPANDGATSDTVKDAYLADGEGWPEYHELRNMIIDAKTFNANGAAEGIIFIDNNNSFTPTIETYTSFGPNNEVYLGMGQSIAFEFTPDDNMESIHIAMRGSYQYAYFTIGTTDGTNLNNGGNIAAYSFDSYYDITSLFVDDSGKLVKRTVVITCPNSSLTDTVLSITNVKITHKQNPNGKSVNPFSITRGAADEALAYLAYMEGEMDPMAQIGIVGATLSFEDEIRTNLYFTSDLDGDYAEKMGLLTWSAMPDAISVENAEHVFPGAVYVDENEQFMVQTQGIAAKNLGDDIYMAVYAEVAEGVYTYSDVITYSPKQYAMNRLEKSDNEDLKALCVAMLNYGTAAQNYFGYKTDALMNAALTAEQQSLVAAYDADLFTGAVAADDAKVGSFAKTAYGFNSRSASVSFEGAFAINYYLSIDEVADGDVSFYIWNAEDYADADILTAENASAVAYMKRLDNGTYWAQIDGIAAKDLDQTFYVAAVYTANGENFCSGVIAYSLSTYCMKAASSGSAMQTLAQSTAVYGYHADVYFNVEG